MMLYHFGRLIKKYSHSFTLEIGGELTYVGGDPVEEAAKITEETGAILPIRAHQIVQSGGSLCAADRQLYMLHPLAGEVGGRTIVYQGQRYTAELSRDFRDFSEVTVYILKWKEEVKPNEPEAN